MERIVTHRLFLVMLDYLRFWAQRAVITCRVSIVHGAGEKLRPKKYNRHSCCSSDVV